MWLGLYDVLIAHLDVTLFTFSFSFSNYILDAEEYVNNYIEI